MMGFKCFQYVPCTQPFGGAPPPSSAGVGGLPKSEHAASAASKLDSRHFGSSSQRYWQSSFVAFRSEYHVSIPVLVL